MSEWTRRLGASLDAQACIMVGSSSPPHTRLYDETLVARYAISASNRHPDSGKVWRRARSRQGRSPCGCAHNAPILDCSCAPRPLDHRAVGTRKRAIKVEQGTDVAHKSIGSPGVPLTKSAHTRRSELTDGKS